MGQASSDLSKRRKSNESPEQNRANTVSTWQAELRAPANDLKLKLDDVSGDCVALQAQLAALGATTPSCVYGKKLLGAQARLKNGPLSIGDKQLDRHVTAALTDGELGIVVDHDRTGGLDVPVFDRDGARYDFKCVYAEDRGCYLLAAGPAEYDRFVAGNKVVSDVAEQLGKELFMEVWTFRSPALGKRSVDDDHPDGALGMVILFFDLDKDGLGGDRFDQDCLTIEHWLRQCPKVSEGYELEQFI